MATKLENVIYGADKTIDFAKFDLGKVLHAIAFDLEEFGKKGVEVRVDKSCLKFIAKHKVRKDLAKPYLRAGVVNGSLMLVLRDAKNDTVEEMTVLFKGYTTLKKKLAASTTAVTNLDPKYDAVTRSVQTLATRHGAKADDQNYSEITGNIILVAHGAPEVLPNGRLIGESLGRKTPAEIFDLLTTSPDPEKRVAKAYNGTLTLCGCFTALGGPTANEKDDVFAKKVLDLFRKKGYKKISVVGYPGRMNVVERAGKDSAKTRTEAGDMTTLANVRAEGDEDKAADLLERLRDAVDAYNRVGKRCKAAERKRDAAMTDLKNAHRTSGISQDKFLATKAGKTLHAAYVSAQKEFTKQDMLLSEREEAVDRVKAKLKKSGLEDEYAHMQGRFGLNPRN